MAKNTIKNYFNTNVLKRGSDSSLVCEESPSAPKMRNEEVTNRQEFANDVANFCKKLTDKEMYDVLTSAWVPDISFNFPSSGNRNLKFKLTWINSFPWLLYSPIQDGAYCRFCVAFGWETVGNGSHQNSNALVHNPFQNWKKAIDKFKEHQLKEYHKKAMEQAANFILIYENKRNDIANEINKGYKKEQLENRKKLASIIRVILVCGRQGLALRGHRDEGSLSLEMPSDNDGNFRALLRLAIESGDESLRQHIESAPRNAPYISWRIQNEIIETAGDLLQRKIIDRINSSKCFSIIADETTDISGIEQFSICIRYVDQFENDKKLREDFLCFIPVVDTTGNGLAKVLIDKLKEMDICMAYIRGQGYDGARSMSGHFKGCAAIIQKLYPEAVYVHCASHSLNLAIASSCQIPAIRNCIGSIKDTVNLFLMSSKAGTVLKDLIVETCPNSKQIRLLKFCETRWVEHLDALSLFFDVFPLICKALEQLDNENVRCEISKPHILLAAICSSQFIIAMTILKPIFALSKNVSQLLQQENCDLSSCVNFANNLYNEVNEMRCNAEQSFKKMFEIIKTISTEVGVEIKIPRLVYRQAHRDNYEGEPEEYYRRSTYVPFLDHFLEQIKDRFLKHRELLSKIENILPTKCIKLTDTQMQETVDVLELHWPKDVEGSAEDFVAELKMWKRHSLNQTNRPTTFIEGLNYCDARIFKTVSRFLQIGATLPVSVASSERSFCSLRRLKTYLRSKTGKDRLNALALLNVHRDVEVKIEDILNSMAKNKRRINILL